MIQPRLKMKDVVVINLIKLWIICFSITYFDFFSLDAFNIAKYSKYLAQILTKQICNE